MRDSERLQARRDRRHFGIECGEDRIESGRQRVGRGGRSPDRSPRIIERQREIMGHIGTPGPSTGDLDREAQALGTGQKFPCPGDRQSQCRSNFPGAGHAAAQ